MTDVLYCHLSNNYLFSEQQFGFRSSKSTSDLLMLLIKGWPEAIDEGHDTVTVALDKVDAFDRLWHEGLLENLHANVN